MHLQRIQISPALSWKRDQTPDLYVVNDQILLLHACGKGIAYYPLLTSEALHPRWAQSTPSNAFCHSNYPP